MPFIDYKPMGNDIVEVFKTHLGECPAFAIAFKLNNKEYDNYPHWLSNIERKDSVDLFMTTARRMRRTKKEKSGTSMIGDLTQLMNGLLSIFEWHFNHEPVVGVVFVLPKADKIVHYVVSCNWDVGIQLFRHTAKRLKKRIDDG